MSADNVVSTLVDIRATNPAAVAEEAAARRRPSSLLGPAGKLMVIAADHPARGALRAGADPLAMADRGDLLERMCLALSRPEVNGVLGTAGHPRGPAAARRPRRQGRRRLDEPRRPGRHVVRDRRPVHRLRRRPHRRDGLRVRQDAAAHRPRRRRDRPDDRGLLARRHRARRPRPGRDGRAVHLRPGRRPGPQRPQHRGRDPLGHGGRGARRHLGLHLAQAARDRRRGRDGAGARRLHAAGRAARRRGPRRPGRRLRRRSSGSSSCPRPRASWSAGPCSTPPTATSPARSTGR